jgi:hypothetical protein
VILVIAVYFALQGAGQTPKDLSALVSDKGDSLLATRDWMVEKDIDTVMVLSKNNRSEGKGVSLQFSRFGCWFDGPGADILLSESGMGDVTDKTLALIDTANADGVFKYVRYPDYFEIAVVGDVYSRVLGMAGTPLYYFPGGTAALSDAKDLGGGWYTGKAAQSGGFTIDTRSSWFYVAVIVLAYAVISAIVALCYKKHEGRATVTGKRTEDVRHLSRLTRQLQGKPPGGFDGFAYQLTFVTEHGEEATVYVPHTAYNELKDGDAGWLVYKQLGKRQKLISFTAEDGNAQA